MLGGAAASGLGVGSGLVQPQLAKVMQCEPRAAELGPVDDVVVVAVDGIPEGELLRRGRLQAEPVKGAVELTLGDVARCVGVARLVGGLETRLQGRERGLGFGSRRASFGGARGRAGRGGWPAAG